DTVRHHPEHAPDIQEAFDALYLGNEERFREAFIEARDYNGRVLAEAWSRLSPDSLDYAEIAELLLALDRELSGGRYQQEMFESFAWREIGKIKVGPRLTRLDEESHAFSARTIVPETGDFFPKMTYRERALLSSNAAHV